MTNRLQLRIAEKIRETPRAATIVFDLLSGPGDYRAGQFLTFIFQDPHLGEIRRSYSLSSAPGIDPRPAITVQQQANGLISRYFVEQARVGDVVEALPAAGQFTLPAQGGDGRDIFLIGGGSGITPLFSLLKYCLVREPQSRVILIAANRDEDHIIFREQLPGLAGKYPHQLQVIHYLSDPRQPLAALRQAFAPAVVRRGRLSNALIEDLVQQQLRFSPDRACFFLCGPAGLLIKAENTLGFMGFAARQVKREVFTIKAAYRPDPGRFPASQVRLQWSGQDFRFTVQPGQTILEAARSAGIDLPYSCKSGSCTTCAAQCRSGKVEMYTQDGRRTTEETGGITLTCVGYPLDSNLLLEI